MRIYGNNIISGRLKPLVFLDILGYLVRLKEGADCAKP